MICIGDGHDTICSDWIEIPCNATIIVVIS